MSPYVGYFAARFRAQLQYRAAAWAGVGTQVFFGLVRIMIFDALYTSSTATQPLSHAETMTYIWLGQALLMLIPFRLDREVLNLIRTGNVAYEIVRPVNLTKVWFARAMADRIGPAILRFPPQILFSAFLLRWVGWNDLALGAPAGAAAFGLFLVSIAAGMFVSVGLAVLVTSSLFRTIAGEGVLILGGAALWLLSGITIPLPLYPDWLQPVIRVLPYRAMMDVPFRIYMGDISGGAALLEILGQLGWAVALYVLASISIRRGLRRVVVQGG